MKIEKLHVNGKRQIQVENFLKIENEQLKTIIMDKKLRETTPAFMCRK